MLYLIRDKRGFVIHVLKVRLTEIDKFALDDALVKYIKRMGIKNSVEFSCYDFQCFLANSFGVASKQVEYDRLNLKV